MYEAALKLQKLQSAELTAASFFYIPVSTLFGSLSNRKKNREPEPIDAARIFNEMFRRLARAATRLLSGTIKVRQFFPSIHVRLNTGTRKPFTKKHRAAR